MVTPIPVIPASLFDQPASVILDGRRLPLSKLTIKGRKLAWKVRQHPKAKANLMFYLPARQLEWWQILSGSLATLAFTGGRR